MCCLYAMENEFNFGVVFLFFLSLQEIVDTVFCVRYLYLYIFFLVFVKPEHNIYSALLWCIVIPCGIGQILV